MKTELICGHNGCIGNLVLVNSDYPNNDDDEYFICELCDSTYNPDEMLCKKCGLIYNCACGGNCTEDH